MTAVGDTKIIKTKDRRWDDAPVIEYTIRTVIEVSMTGLLNAEGERQDINTFLGNFATEEDFIEFATLDRDLVTD